MDNSKQTKTVDKWRLDSATPDIPQIDNTAAALEAQTQSIAEVTEPEPEAQPQKKKQWLIALVAVLALGVISGVAWFVIANNGNSDEVGEVANEGGKGEDGNSGQEAEPEPEPAPVLKPEVVALSLDDELVRTLFNEFSPITDLWDGNAKFYTQAVSGNLSRQLAMNIAFSNVLDANRYTSSGCKGSYKFMAGNGEQWIATSCYSGEKMRQEIAKLFGFDYVFTENDVLTTSCSYVYNTVNDEFHQTQLGCGGWPLAGIVRGLYRAEKDTERIYLYEMAAYWSQADAGDSCDAEACRLGDEEWDVGIDGVTAEELKQQENLSEYPWASEIFSKFKWTFVWNGENYVFEKLERV